MFNPTFFTGEPHMEIVSKLQFKRIEYLDIARGLCIIAIVLGHLQISQINSFVFTFHIPVFFLITGYFFNPTETVLDTANHKIKTLIRPYFTASLLTIISSVAFNVIVFHKTVNEVINDVLHWLTASLYGAGGNITEPVVIPGIGAIWFLWATMWGIIVTLLLIKLPRIARFIAVIILVILAKVSADHIMFLPLSIQPGLIAVLYIYSGYEWRNNKEKFVSMKTWIKVVVAILAFLVWAEFVLSFKSFWLVTCDLGRGVQDVVGSFCASAMILAGAFFADKYGRKFAGFIRFLGRYSILTLAAHIIELNTFPWAEYEYLLNIKGVNSVIILILKIVIKFTWIYLFTLLFSRYNFTRMLFGMKLKRPQSKTA